jgi:hypothetical protein
VCRDTAGDNIEHSRCATLASLSKIRGGGLMAKALYGHVGGPDPRMVAEVRRLQRRVRDLEDELVRVKRENDELAATVSHEELLTLTEQHKEPALT